ASDTQRAKLMTLQAESLVRTRKAADARKVLHQLTTLYPQQADPAQTTLLLGEAKLLGDERSTAEALVTLRKLIADHPETPAAARAQHDIIVHDPAYRASAARAEAMAQWLGAHADHELADAGRRVLLDAYLSLASQGTKPTAVSDLSPGDLKAITLAAEIYRHDLPIGAADALTKQLLDHVNARYAAVGANAAAARALETLLAAPLPRSNRLTVLKSLGSYKYLLAAKWLEDTARAGLLPVGVPRGQLPKQLTDVLATFEATRAEYPAEPLWIDQANLAKRVRASAASVLPTAVFQGLKGPDTWALDIAIPVIKANADPEAVKSAAETVLGIIQERAQ
ncbi:hypothetical protein LCGC14_3138150, partial [marine sediment metagenome]